MKASQECLTSASGGHTGRLEEVRKWYEMSKMLVSTLYLVTVGIAPLSSYQIGNSAADGYITAEGENNVD